MPRPNQNGSSSPMVYPSLSSSLDSVPDRPAMQDATRSDVFLSPGNVTPYIGNTPMLEGGNFASSFSDMARLNSSDDPRLFLPHHQTPLTMTDIASRSSHMFLTSQIDNTPSGSRLPQSRYNRHDVGAPQRTISMLPSSDHPENADLLSSLGHEIADPDHGRIKVIWGTNIVIHETVSQFKDFLLHFTLAHVRLEEGQLGAEGGDLIPYYPLVLKRLHETELSYLNLDGKHLRSYRQTRNLYDQLIKYPQEMIPLMDLTLNEVYVGLFPELAQIQYEPLQVRPFNIDRMVNLREISPSEVDQLLTLKGLVIRSTPILPDMRTAFFQCSQCEFSMTVENVKGTLAEPQKCPRVECGALHSMVLIHNRSLFSDKQIIKLQETPDRVPDGQTPHAVTLCVYDKLVDSVRPGDRSVITGIFRVSPVRINHRQRRIRNLFRTYIDVLHIQTQDDKRVQLASEFRQDSDESEESAFRQMEQQIHEISRMPNLYERLARSVAPSLWQLDDVKKALLLQLFGGVTKELHRSGQTRFRGDIHVLLAGDPSVAKSQLLQAVHSLSPRGLYTSGKGSSAVGLTAYITRDPESGSLVLESGALVLSDGGLCCIDEFDKMSDSTRAILHEVMEQQTLSISKAGILTTLHARTSVLAAANPIDSKYNPSRSILENLNLPPSLLSRFDLICLMLDIPNEALDLQLAKHIISLHVDSSNRIATDDDDFPSLDVKIFAKYISYARQLNPVLSEEAIRPLLDGYVGMRQVNSNENSSISSNPVPTSRNDKTVSATTRQLESLIRLSEAHARMRLSTTVDPQDVSEALRLIQAALLSFALDPVTGKIDMGLVQTGKGTAYRQKTEKLRQGIVAILDRQKDSSNGIQVSTLARELAAETEMNISDALLRLLLQELVDADYLTANGPIRDSTIISKLNK